ncbi:MAG: DUF4385 domain-containing protein [Oscillatoria sp. PMC 1068.18]|nr:DUF4385 domain-containing protein [Oscillatoria sp. PMC 1076.18]MEC4991333.1 DUF4385 domain-containing protein [Oscillatoria sp. PMC 1068.18]
MTHSDDNIDFRNNPELYKIGRGEQGIFHVEPYKSELLPLWTIKTLATAKEACENIYKNYLEYRSQSDFVGMDMARKFLQMGYTRARRYANYKGGNKKKSEFGSGDPIKAEIAEIYREKWQMVTKDTEYQKLKKLHQSRSKSSESEA